MYNFNELKNNRVEFLLTNPKDPKKYDLSISSLLEKICFKEYLWEDLYDFSNSHTITLNYRQMLVIAKAYHCKESIFYKDDLILEVISNGFEFLHNKVYNKKYSTYFGNWWDWEIGVPLTMLNIMFLIDLPQKDKYLDVIEFFCPDPRYSMQKANRDMIVSVGANRVDCVKRAVLMGILKEDEEIIADAVACLFDVLNINDICDRYKIEDGFYSDFSFIQHNNIPYTGTYGNVLLSGIVEILITLGEKFTWLIKDKNIIYEIIENSFMPIIYNGYSFDMLNGRGATREDMQSIGFGIEIISSIALFADFAPKKYAEKFNSFVKYQILKVGIALFEKYVHSSFVLKKLYQIQKNETILPKKLPNKTYAYNIMERMICIRDDFTVGFALNSKRIKPYEYMLGENKQGYHLSDGAYYIYTENNEFSNNYIATLNPNKIPGTTIIDKNYDDGKMTDCQQNSISNVMKVDDYYGVACMEIIKENGLIAKKSYFVLDNEIVVVGSGINIMENTKTIVDTKKYKSDILKTDDFWYLDGTAYISQNYLLHETYTQKRCFFDINENGSKLSLTQKYNTIFINNTIYTDYYYRIIPVIYKENVPAYLSENRVDMLKNNTTVHSIKYKNMHFINFWERGKYSNIETTAPVSICIKEETDKFCITISDTSKQYPYILIRMLNENKENIFKLNKFETKYFEVRKEHQNE